jgi:hypothetical protein
MTLTVKHSITADGSFTAAGKTAWDADHTVSGTISVADGGTGVTASSGPNSVVLRDSLENISANDVSIRTSIRQSVGSTVVLTAGSFPLQVVTQGAQSTETFQLPNATTLPIGKTFFFKNESITADVYIVDNDNTLLYTVYAGGGVRFTLFNNLASYGVWYINVFAPRTVSWGTNILDYTGTISASGGIGGGNF